MDDASGNIPDHFSDGTSGRPFIRNDGKIKLFSAANSFDTSEPKSTSCNRECRFSGWDLPCDYGARGNNRRTTPDDTQKKIDECDEKFKGWSFEQEVDSIHSTTASSKKNDLSKWKDFASKFDELPQNAIAIKDSIMETKPYKVCDVKRENNKGVTASSFESLKEVIRNKFSIPNTKTITLVLDGDGTEVEDDDYFGMLEQNTKFMVLIDTEKWYQEQPYRLYNQQTDHVDGQNKEERSAKNLVQSIHQNLCHISLLEDKDLEVLANMDPDSLLDLLPEKRNFIEQVKEASERVLYEKQQADEAMALLKFYHESMQKKESEDIKMN